MNSFAIIRWRSDKVSPVRVPIAKAGFRSLSLYNGYVTRDRPHLRHHDESIPNSEHGAAAAVAFLRRREEHIIIKERRGELQCNGKGWQT